MAKFCGKCGAKLDETTGLCPNCSQSKGTQQVAGDFSQRETEGLPSDKKPLSRKAQKQQRKEEKKAAQKEKKRAKKAAMSTGQKVRRFFAKLLLGLLLLAVLVVGVLSALVYFGVLDIPVVEKTWQSVERIFEKIPSPANQGQQDSDNCYRPNPENIIYEDEEETFGYVNNMVLVFVPKETSKEEVEQLAKEINGTIVGQIPELHQYQIQVEPREREELEKLCDQLMKNKSIEYALLDGVTAIDTSSVQQNDPWKDPDKKITEVNWNEADPTGTNWWLKATKVVSAWKHQNEFSNINVGVVDAGFDITHEDLNINILPGMENHPDDHGTRVAGIVGATANNGLGIRGVLDHVDLYGVCWKDGSGQATTESEIMKEIVTCLANGCKVVNCSFNTAFQKGIGTETVKENAEYSSYTAAIYLMYMLENYGKNFIIVESAGNGDWNGIGVDASKYGGYFASITQETYQKAVEKYKEVGKTFDQEIDEADIVNAFMVVGGVDKERTDSKWQLTSFSNYGKAITVCAPAKDVLSTIVMRGKDENYGYDDGTSFAAPIVSGITAMAWSADPTLSAGEIRKIIVETAKTPVLSRNNSDKGSYYMIDANAAVEAVLAQKEQHKQEKMEQTEEKPSQTPAPQEERDIVLLLDESGSMDGDPIDETKKAAKKFIQTILGEGANIGIVSYNEEAEQKAAFSQNQSVLTQAVSELDAWGGTNMEAGLVKADRMLQNSKAKKKIIVLMSDGEPNEGKEGDELIAYADSLKDNGTTIYTLGFFEALEGDKASAQALMEQIASEGCHYEVANADDLVFFFRDVADQINGQKYIYVRIACPVEVNVSYEGETLNSAEGEQTLRTNFGTLTFEENEDGTDTTKILRLKEGCDYDLKIVGTGRGFMDYTIGFMDDNGDYTDLRRFEHVKITKKTTIDTEATVSETSMLKIDEDGDGRYDLKLQAGVNGYGEEVKMPLLFYVALAAGCGAVVIALILMIRIKLRKKSRR